MRSMFLCAAAVAALIPCSCQPFNPGQTTSAAKPGSTPTSAGQVVVGGLYAVKNPDDTYSVEKVLVTDAQVIHLRRYANVFPTRPDDVDSSKLNLGGISLDDLKAGKPVSMGVGHYPLAADGFLKDSPVFLRQEPVKDEELEGYKEWLRGNRPS